MGTVYFDMTMSLDGFIAGPNVSMELPLGEGGEELHDWMFSGKTEEQITAFQEAMFRNVGAVVMGRTMLDLGIGPWGDEPVYHCPVFVVTHRPHEAIARKGGTTYSFVTDGLESALRQAKAAAVSKDIRIAGGANVVQQCLKAGVITEVRLEIAPRLLGGGVPLFDGLEPDQLVTTSVAEGGGAVHLRYRVGKR
jgi:dihydrofolate reductase